MARDGLTSDERATYQALCARGVSHEDARNDALDGVHVEDVRRGCPHGHSLPVNCGLCAGVDG